MRTQTLTEPGSWRAWGGQDFNISLVDPYVLERSGGDPREHICVPLVFPPVGPGREFPVVQGLLWSVHMEMFIAVIRLYRESFTPGASPIMFSVSKNLIDWAALQTLYSPQPYGDWWVNYPTLLDPTAPARGDLNFETVGKTAVLYFSLAPQAHTWRSLVSVPIEFDTLLSPQGLFKANNGIYYSNGNRHYCYFPNMEEFKRITGRADAVGIPDYEKVPDSMLSEGACSSGLQGLFRIGNGIFYSNGRYGLCYFPDMETFKRITGRNDADGIPEYEHIPWYMINSGICQGIFSPQDAIWLHQEGGVRV